MCVTMRELWNPMRGFRATPRHFTDAALKDQPASACLCGRMVEFNEAGEVKPHRPKPCVHDVKNEDGLKLSAPMNRKARKASWCPIPTILGAAVKAGMVAL